jgi:hypothetical protein
MWCPAAWAQLDIFEKPRDRPPPERKGFTFGPIRVGGQGGQRHLVEGGNLYRQRNYAAASLKYFRVVQQMSGSRWMPTAEVQLAKSLYRMGLLRSAQQYFTRIVEVGSSHRHYSESIVFLIRISRRLQDLSFLEKLTRIRVSELPPKYRDELLYLLGRYYYQNDKIPQTTRMNAALKLLNQVDRNNHLFYARSQYIIGAIYANSAKPDDPRAGALRNSAAQAFRLCGIAANRISNRNVRENLRELAILGLARIHYESQHFRAAIRFYKSIPRSSSRWLDALFEMAWSYLKLGRYSHTLGLLHTLDSPYFQNYYYPEVGILRAMSFFESCRYQDVKNIVELYLKRYQPLSKSMRDFMQRYPTPERLYSALLEMRTRETVQGLDDDASSQTFQRILRMTFQDQTLNRMFLSIKLLDEEIGKLGQVGEVWSRSMLANQLQQLLKTSRQQRLTEAGTHARNRFLFVLGELQKNISLALSIRYETLGAEKDLLQQSTQQKGDFEMRQRAKRQRLTFSVSVSDEFIFWPFQGEYWVDELGYYRYRIKGECRK